MDSIRPGRTLVALALALSAALASAAELPRAAIVDSRSAVPSQLAFQFELKLRLIGGHGLARSLLDLGVDSSDAEVAARLAAGHLGDEFQGCQARIALARPAEGRSLRLVRVMLSTDASQTVIERRGGELAVASQTEARPKPRLA